MNHHRLSAISQVKLHNVHPALVRVVKRALKMSKYDFGITCGVRTLEEQQELFDNGDTQTMNSKHLIQVDGTAHAIDFVVWVDGKISWNSKYYRKVMQAFISAAIEEEVQIELGGLWESFIDGPHIQLSFI